MSKLMWLLLFLAVPALADAQGSNDGFVSEREGMQHLLRHPPPEYPPVARAAGLHGPVVLHVAVDRTGAVTTVEAVDGPDMLRAAAAEAVSKWTYRPFLVNGTPAAVRVIVSVPSMLGLSSAMEKKDAAVGLVFYPKLDECRAASSQRRWDEAVKLCADAVDMAERFPDTDFRANEIRGAHQSYGVALTFAGKAVEGLAQLQTAVELASKSLTPKDAEYASAFRALASAEAGSRMLTEADRDYGTAEDSYRQLVVGAGGLKRGYEMSLARSLVFHSMVAEQMGNDARAKAMKGEAVALDSHALDGMGSKV